MLRCAVFGLALMHSVVIAKPAEVCVKDDIGHPVCIQHAQRVLVLAPHLTEIVGFVGGLNKVMAVDSASDYPPAARKLPKISNPGLLGAESILARKPDLVLAWQSGISMSVVSQLRKAGIPVFLSEPRSIEQVSSTMRRVGELMGTAAQTHSKVDAWLQQFDGLRSQYRRETPIPVFYQVWRQPLMTLGGSHVVSEIISLCGGRNVFSDVENLAVQVSVESVLKRRPAVLMTSGPKEGHPAFLEQWRTWSQLPAVQNGQLHTLPSDILVRNGPRLIDASRLVCATLQNAKQVQN
ncbi:MAG TPA: cobalamin-binding protein [Limnobacter sp.]|nr:cobalamin-binding protein [Limnobacter sp.]